MDLKRVLTESLEQQTATSEILRVISSSPTDVQPVFDTIIQSAVRLCGARIGALYRFDGELLHLAAHHNVGPDVLATLLRLYPMRPNRETASGRAILGRAVAELPDVLADPEFRHEIAIAGDWRSMLAVPMLREGDPIGAIVINRSEPGAFPESQIALLQTFADQAVIAIENVRLFTELQEKNRALTTAHAQVTEALEQQTATAAVLRVIGSSPTDAQPVFEAIVSSARRLLGGFGGAVYRVAGDEIHLAAYVSTSPAGDAALRSSFPRPLAVFSPPGEAIRGRAPVVLTDVDTDKWVPDDIRELIRKGWHRSGVWVPMMREGVALGAIGVTRSEPGSFTDEQIALLKTFADQAVIAIENVRLFTELQQKNEALTTAHSQVSEALEQQTATSEILRVISQSPTDTQPVFDAIVERALRLSEATVGAVAIFDGELIHVVASNLRPDSPILRVFPMRPSRTGSLAARAVFERQIIHVPDALTEPEYNVSQQAAESGYRSVLSVPMLRDGTVVGTIIVGRSQAGRYLDRQIALLQTFADQAVIAIENVRLFKELETKNRDLTESLAQQTATGEILEVIAHSPTDIRPVLDTVAESAARLCEASDVAIFRLEGDRLRVAAHHGPIPLQPASDPTISLHGTVPGRSVLEARTIHVTDLQEEAAEFPEGSELARRFGFRTSLTVPLIRQGAAVGTITLRRTEARRFSERQVALLQTFADQAVIAIENVRLFTELQEKNRALTQAHAQLTEALEQQTATSEILRVISSSPTDLQPVLDTVVASAARYCGAYDATMLHLDGGSLRLAAHHGPIPIPVGRPIPVVRGTTSGRAVLERRAVHVTDIQAEAEEFPESRAFAKELGYRTQLSVPLLREGAAIGTIVLRRIETNPFTDKQIALLQTFADQAVIAIENVRLFTELQASNRELTTALDTQTATGDILGVISRSQTDVQPVFDAIVDSAVRLLSAYSGVLTRVKGEQIEFAALTSTNDAGDAAARALYPEPLQSERVTARAIRERVPLNVGDTDTDPRLPEAEHARARVRGYRSLVVVPMLRHDEAVGAIAVTRREAGGFSDDEIALLKTFADQAVIAIENVRLFKELQERNRDLTEALEQQTATSEILRVISSSPTDLGPVMDAVAENAARLCDASDAQILRADGEAIALVASYGSLPTISRDPRPISRRLVGGRAIIDRVTLHIPDVTLVQDEFPDSSTVPLGVRTALAIPLLREGTAIGVIMIRRMEVRPFSDKQVALLQTFADQAVIAVENVRLFKELEARTGELTQSVEKLTALGEVSRAVSSTLDVETVLDTIVSRANQLAGADACGIYEYDEDEQMFHVRATHNFDAAFVARLRVMPLHRGEGVAGRATEAHEPIQVVDIAEPGAYESRVRDLLIGAGYRAVLSVPLLREEQIIGSLSLVRKVPGEYSPEVIEVLKTFATQSALAIQNARLFREIADKSRQLEAASRHKSEFLANMSHELRTPLNAIIGFSEVLAQGMFGEINEKQTEYLGDILDSGRHLLSLINDILDLSKIEAGRMELELTDFYLPQAIQNALTLVRERALRRGIALHHAIDDRVADIRADERKVKQVLLNLLSNAIKFTPEGGRIDVRAAPADGLVEVSVTDTGVGIAPEDHEAVFEEFRQVGATDKKAEGTGLGLALSRRFIELHGGQISVQSEIGHGSTFTFTLPVRP